MAFSCELRAVLARLLRDAFDVIHAVDPKQHRAPLELPLQLLNALTHAWRLERSAEAHGVDADRKGVHLDCVARDATAEALGELPFPSQPVSREGDLGSEQAGASVQEVSRIVIHVKANEVGAEEALQDLLAHRQRAEDLR